MYHPLWTWTTEQQATTFAFRLSLFYKSFWRNFWPWAQKQQPQSPPTFLLQDCHHVPAQRDSVPNETAKCYHWMDHHHQPVSEPYHFGCHLLPRRAAPEAKHKDAWWLCLFSPAPLQLLPSLTAWLYFLLSNYLPPRETTFPHSRRVESTLLSVLVLFGEVNRAAAGEYFHKTWSRAQSCCTLWPWYHSPVWWDTVVNGFFKK